MNNCILLISDDVKYLESIGPCCGAIISTTILTDNHSDAISTIANERPDLIIFDLESPCAHVESVLAFLVDDKSFSETPTLMLTASRTDAVLKHCRKPPSYYVAKSPNMSLAMLAAMGELLPKMQGNGQIKTCAPEDIR